MSSRNILLILVLFAAFAANSQYFAPVGAKWYYNTDPFMSLSYVGYHLFEVEKDTMINGLACSKIVESRHYSVGVTENISTNFVRYDNRRVYYYRYGQFKLLYDFNLEAGDTLHFYDPGASSFNPDTITDLPIDSVVYVEQSGHFYKTFYFGEDPTSFFRIKTGVAEMVGGLYWPWPITKLVIDQPGVLRCYQDSAVYINLSPGDSTACDYTWTNPLLIGLPETDIGEGVRVWPNPVNDVLNITFPNGAADQIRLFDLLGNVVEAPVLSSNGTTCVLDVSGLGSGVYMVGVGQSFTCVLLQ